MCVSFGSSRTADSAALFAATVVSKTRINQCACLCRQMAKRRWWRGNHERAEWHMATAFKKRNYKQEPDAVLTGRLPLLSALLRRVALFVSDHRRKHGDFTHDISSVSIVVSEMGGLKD